MILLKSVLSSLPSYYMPLYKLPMQVSNSIDVIQRRFLWGGNDERKKLFLVKWSIISRSKKLRGSGITPIRPVNGPDPDRIQHYPNPIRLNSAQI